MNKSIIKSPVVIIGHIFFLSYIILSLFLYKERICFYDSAFHFFKIVHFDSYIFEASRYSSFLPQTITFLGLQIGLPLKMLIALYSISFPLIFYSCFIITVYVFKNIQAAIIMMLAMVIGQMNFYFCPMADTHQTLIYCALFFGFLEADLKINFVIRNLINISLILLCLFSHPVAVFLVAFIAVYHYISKKPGKLVEPIILIFVVCLFMGLKVYFTPAGSYEGSFFSNILNYKQAFSNGFFTIYPFVFIYKNFLSLYLIPILLGIISIYYLIKRKFFLQLAVFILATGGLFLISIISYYMGDGDVQMERAFLPVIFFVYFPVSQYIIEHSQSWERFIKPIILCILLIFGFRQIMHTGQYYSYRISKMYELLDKTKNREGDKFIVTDNDIKDFPTMTWAFPYESLLLSSLNNPSDSKTLFYAYHVFDLGNNDTDTTFLGAPFWLQWDAKSLNSKYFKLEDGKYQYLNETQEVE